MSLILEALRKSEAERRRGQAPDLLSEVVPAPHRPEASAPRNRTWLYAATAVVLALAVAWWSWSRSGATTVDTPSNQSSATVEAVQQPANVGPVRAEPAPTVAVRAAADTPAAPATAALPPEKPAAPASGPNTVSPITAATPAETEPDAARVPTAVATVEPPPAPPLAPTPAPAPETKGLPSFTSPDLPLRLGDLSSEERRQLPPLRISMHMFGSDAAQRFAIIDGNRVGEGDRVGEASVEAIQQDSVMLAWRGRRIRLPIR